MAFSIKEIPLFALCNDEELELIQQLSEKISVKKNEYLFQQNEDRNYFYVLEKGMIEIVKSTHDTLKPVIRIEEKNFISENALLDDRPHASSALAIANCRLQRFEKVKLKTFLSDNPVISGKIYPQLANTLSDRLYKMNLKKSELESRSYSGKHRIEHDLLGDREIEENAYYGVQTDRAMENFKITGITLAHYPSLVKSLAYVKKASAIANYKLEYIPKDIFRAIKTACDEIIDGEFLEDFTVDIIQGGAGTSTNMNANEVIANRASEILGHKKGSYYVHPNNHVNLSQSTNDAYPTAIRLTVLLTIDSVIKALNGLIDAFRAKGEEFKNVIKMGRTQLQDAVPMTLGQEFEAYAITISEDLDRLKEATSLFKEMNMGATAIGTGINADPNFGPMSIKELSKLTKLKLLIAPNLIEATQDMGAFITFSSTLKRISVKISKICNDLRLLSSGPRAGLNEINLPPMQPGSSIMPGKVNPVIPEVVNQIAFQVIGNDLAITLAAEAGQLQLNVMEPVIVYNIFQSMMMLKNGFLTLTHKCVKGITANEEHCRNQVENSISIITALNPFIGYENSSSISKEALASNRSITDIVLERKLLTKQQLSEILTPENMTQPKPMKKINE